MGSAGKKLRTRMDIGKDIQNCLDDLNNMTHAKLAELLNLSEKTVDRNAAWRKHCTGHGGNDCSANDDRKHDGYADG